MTTGIRSCDAQSAMLCGVRAYVILWVTMLRSAAGHNMMHRTAQPNQALAAGGQALRVQATSRSPSLASLLVLRHQQRPQMLTHKQALGAAMQLRVRGLTADHSLTRQHSMHLKVWLTLLQTLTLICCNTLAKGSVADASTSARRTAAVSERGQAVAQSHSRQRSMHPKVQCIWCMTQTFMPMSFRQSGSQSWCQT